MLFGFAAQTFAQDKQEEKGVLVFGEANDTETSRQVNLAMDLVEYGYKHESAISLVQAAVIFAEHPVAPLVVKDSEGKPIETETPDYNYNPQDLFKDAKTLAKNDANLLAYIENEEAELANKTKGIVLVAAETATIKISGNRSEAVFFGLDKACVYRITARSNAKLGMDVTTKPGFFQQIAGFEDKWKGYKEGYNPSLTFGVLAYPEVCAVVYNLNSSSTKVEVVLEKIIDGPEALRWITEHGGE